MGLNINIALNAYSIIILFVLLFHSIKQSDKNSLQFKLFFSIIAITLFSLFFDSLARLDGQPNTILPILNHVSNFMIFLISPILPSIWILYVHDEIYHDGTMTKRFMMPLFYAFGINAIFLIISQFTYWYYFIDAQNIYQRGPFFFISALFTILLTLVAFVMIIKNKKKLIQSTIMLYSYLQFHLS